MYLSLNKHCTFDTTKQIEEINLFENAQKKINEEDRNNENVSMHTSNLVHSTRSDYINEEHTLCTSETSKINRRKQLGRDVEEEEEVALNSIS